jgi:hypothetical protein
MVVSTRFPAFCPSCGLIFESRLLAVEGTATNITLSGNREQCPSCGSWAELPDGTFNVIGETIEILAASRLTRARLRRLADILEMARDGDISDDSAAQAVMEEAPVLAPLVRRFGPTMQRALVYLLLTIINILLAQGLSELRDDSATRQDVIDAVNRAVEICHVGHR